MNFEFFCYEQFSELREICARLSEEIRDVRELRYANHQDIGSIEARLKEVEMIHNKKPHKCQDCHGTGVVHIKKIAEQDYQVAKKGDLITLITVCVVCEGNGMIEDRR